jgi:hypothetical protein
VFVGREDLLDPLVSAIRRPTARGTYLISGYRGTGKTTLLIEALRQGAQQLPDGWRLFALILNVSEVSASLAGDARDGEEDLRIDPKRLLVALLRSLRHRAALMAPPPDDLMQLIDRTYDKAMAAEYSRQVSDRAEATRTLTREFGLDLKISDVYRFISVGAALGSVLLGAYALGAHLIGAVSAAALVLGSLSAASFYMSRKVTVASSDARSEARSLRFDNSLQQLENDLKDILSRLHGHRLRTVVVLEELDKIDDLEGEQLDAVIRYFKNLFTQAPALFFFVTDKGYFDLISSRIKQARRRRSYAVEHTFFTHRVFVGRPTTRDCLEFLHKVALDEGHQERLKDTYAGGERPTKTLGDLDLFGRLVRVLLFRASNHLFDLKNEMRHFIRARDGAAPDSVVELVVDGRSLPEDQAAVAVLQDRVEEKARSFALASGRTYANEVLHDCLYSVFNELGSTKPQHVADFYPFPPAKASDATSKPQLLLDEQLEWNEVERIEEAVTSLIGDLHRGGAFDTEKTDASQEFVWKTNAARTFRYVRKLERHEEELASKIRKLSTAAAAFRRDGLLAWLSPGEGLPESLVDRLSSRAKEIINADTPVPAEEALSEPERWRLEIGWLMSRAYEAQTQRLSELYGVPAPLQIAPSDDGGGVYLLQTVHGDPRFSGSSPSSAVLLVQGDGDRLTDDMREFAGSAQGLQRLAVVHVLHTTGDSSGLGAWEQAWLTEGSRLNLPGFVSRVLALDEGLSGPNVRERWGRALGRELLFRALWAEGTRLTLTPDPDQAGALATDPSVIVSSVDLTGSVPPGARVRFNLSSALKHWIGSSASRLLWVQPRRDNFDDVVRALRLSNLPDIAVLELPAGPALVEGLSQLLTNQFMVQSGLLMAPMADAIQQVKGMVSDGAMIVAVRGPILQFDVEVVKGLLGHNGRGIIEADVLPDAINDLGVTKIEFLME